MPGLDTTTFLDGFYHRVPLKFERLEPLNQQALGSSSNQWSTRVPLSFTRVYGKRWKLTQPLAPNVSCLHMGSGFLTEVSIIYSPRAYLISVAYTRPTFQKSARHCISCLIFSATLFSGYFLDSNNMYLFAIEGIPPFRIRKIIIQKIKKVPVCENYFH